MEFLDEESRPRFLFQSRPTPSSPTDSQSHQKPSKPFFFVTISISSILLLLSLLFLQSEPLKSLLFWVSLSLFLGPFAPASLTGGDVRVGQGPIVVFPPNQEPETLEETNKRASQKRQKPHRNEGFLGVNSVVAVEKDNGFAREEKEGGENGGSGGGFGMEEEKEWTEEDIGVLRKQLAKHPVGKPGRWEAISEAFRGRHKVESVIKTAKELGERKVDDGDSYAHFLRKRKPVDKRADGENEGLDGRVVENGEATEESGGGEGGVGWSNGEDIALLNALKTFPKEVAMRWEKIAAAVPGKSKAACMKRVAELKRDFRSAKAATES
ncbi:transcription factor MAMYB [Alnus glutinosa]|uniref:transcription factor MAMYB n=1 Tax=Alnus glutinosa TaxID=3517 RepID=UPI002D764A2D|nr:transcription factor MAMYB [Alnus glutinosa]